MIRDTARQASTTALREFSLHVTPIPFRGESFPQFLGPELPFGQQGFLFVRGRLAEPGAQRLQVPKVRPRLQCLAGAVVDLIDAFRVQLVFALLEEAPHMPRRVRECGGLSGWGEGTFEVVRFHALPTLGVIGIWLGVLVAVVSVVVTQLL